MKCFQCGKEIEEGVLVLEWDEDGAFLTGGIINPELAEPKPEPRDIYCNDECLDAYEAANYAS